jgi:hypothetical protein
MRSVYVSSVCRLLWITSESVVLQLVSLEKRESSMLANIALMSLDIFIYFLLILTYFSVADMQKKYFKKKCCLMLV